MLARLGGLLARGCSATTTRGSQTGWVTTPVLPVFPGRRGTAAQQHGRKAHLVDL